MAASVSSGDDDVVADINITPLVDVVLVLLIVFMVTAPAVSAVAKVKANLPTSKSIAITTEKLSYTLELRRGGAGQIELYINDQATSEDDLQSYFTDILKDKEPEDVTVSISADEALGYGEVTGVLDMLSLMKLNKIALITKHIDSK